MTNRLRSTRPVRILVLASAGLALTVTAACSTSDKPADSAPEPTRSGPSPKPPADSSAPPATEGPPKDRTAATILDQMTIEQRVGQLLMAGGRAAEIPEATYTAISKHHVGNVMLIEKSEVGSEATATQVRSLKKLVNDTSTANAKLFVATDQEGGQVRILRGAGFSSIPSAVEQGKLSPTGLRKRAKGWGTELRSAGVNMNLAPVLDTVPSPSFAPKNSPIGAIDRQYGFSPAKVASHGTAFLRGMSDAGVASTIKHFPGLGRVTGNTDFSARVTDRVTTRRDPYLEPFAAGIEAGSPFVMMSTAYYSKIDPDNPAIFSRTIVSGMLRGDLGFKGVVITDDVSNAEQVASFSAGERAVKFVAAGGDMVLAVDPNDMPAMSSALLRKAKQDPGFKAKVDAAALHVLQAKYPR